MILFLLIMVAAVFLGISAFFSASETALFSIPRERLLFFEGNSKKSYKTVHHLLSDGQRTLLMIVLGNTFVNITLTGLIYSLINKTLGVQSPLLTLAAATLIIVIFGEMLPKNIALKRNEPLAVFFSPYLFHLKVIAGPVLTLIQGANQFFLNRLKKRLRRPSPFITLEELKTGITESARSGAISREEQKIISGILEKGVQPVRKLMTHRSLLPIISEDTVVSAALEKLLEVRQPFLVVRNSRYPEQVTGTVNLSTLIRANSGTALRKVTRIPLWVPESIEIAELLRLLFQMDRDNACVLDEFGTFCGVFSLSTNMNKFLETISPVSSLQHKGAENRTMMFSGAQDIAEIQSWLPEELKKSNIEARTLNGLLTNYFGKIPKTGDRFVIDGRDFYIILANPTRIESVIIRKRNENEY